MKFKNRRLKIVILIISIIVVLSCGKKTDSELLVIDTQSTVPTEKNLSEYFKSDGMVALETNDSCLITSINKVIRTKNELFILSNKDYENEIFKFALNGKFICRIGRIGNGPGEYRSLHCISTDTSNKQLIAACDAKILFYSYNGSFLKSYPLASRMFVEDLYVLEKRLWIFGIRFNSGSLVENFFISYDSTFEVNDSVIFARYNSEIIRVTANPNIVSDISTGRYVYFPVINPKVSLRDTLFQFDGNKLKPVIKLDFTNISKNSYPEVEIISNASKEDLQAFNSLKIEGVYRTDQYLLVNYKYKLGYLFIYDFQNQSGQIISGFKDDLFINRNNVFVSPIPLDLKKGEFYYSISGVRLEGKLDGIDENSNPVIFLLTTKKKTEKV